MTIPEIHNILAEKFPAAEAQLEEIHIEPVIRIKSESLVEVAEYLRDDDAMAFDCLMCLSGVETKEELQVVYHLYSMKHGHKVTLRCAGSIEEELSVPTLSFVWRTAEWHEREAYDLFGITFENHPDFRRILLPDDWEGYPLRKDYTPQEKWHDIPLTTQEPLKSDREFK